MSFRRSGYLRRLCGFQGHVVPLWISASEGHPVQRRLKSSAITCRCDRSAVVPRRLKFIQYRTGVWKGYRSRTKSSPKRKFLGGTSRGHRGVIRADVPAQNFGQGGQNPGKTSISARTSMILRSEELWAEFSFPNRSLFPDPSPSTG